MEEFKRYEPLTDEIIDGYCGVIDYGGQGVAENNGLGGIFAQTGEMFREIAEKRGPLAMYGAVITVKDGEAVATIAGEEILRKKIS